jgi:hypothetical protein
VTEPIFESVLWIYKMFMTFIVAVIILFIIGTTITNELNTIELQKELLFSRILYSPDGFWYVDENGVMHTGVVNLANFNQERVNNAFDYPQRYGGAKITLTASTIPYTSAVSQPAAVYVNNEPGDQTYDTLRTQISSGLRNAGTLETRSYPVLIKENNQEKNGILTIEVVVPKIA